MPKKKIRAFRTFANVFPGIHNFPVYFITYEGWSNYSLATCMNCGELFVVDWENPMSNGMTLEELADSKPCPKCNSELKDTIADYPKSIRLPNGNIGSYLPDNNIPPDEGSILIDVIELKP